MKAIRHGSIGILPAGALGAAFFSHLTARLENIDGSVFFIGRTGSRSSQALVEAGALRFESEGDMKTIPLEGLFLAGLPACLEFNQLPEVLLVCPNPDQLLAVLDEYVGLLEVLFATNQLSPQAMPTLVLSANGIYFARARQMFIERLEEATLFGRLPDLWPDLMPRIIGRVIRGVTIQTGIRRGSGAGAVYSPGPPGITRLAGGDDALRRRAHALLSGRGAWFELAGDLSPTRLEFDKAQINLCSNLLGQIYSLTAPGGFRPLKVCEIYSPGHEDDIRELTRNAFLVGRAVRAYGPEEDREKIHRELIQAATKPSQHVPSSVQLLAMGLRDGTLKAELTPTEAWLLDPLIRYARTGGLESTARYFEALRQKLLGLLRAAVAG